MKTLITLGLLLFSHSIFAQSKESIVLDSNYFNRVHSDFVNSTYWQHPVFAAADIDKIRASNGSCSFCVYDSIPLSNGKAAFLYAIATTNMGMEPYETTYYLSVKCEEVYSSFKLFSVGRTARMQAHYVELTDGQFLKQYNGNELLGITDLFHPAPLLDLNATLFSFNPSSVAYALVMDQLPPFAVNSYSMSSYVPQMDWSTISAIRPYIVYPAIPVQPLEKPFDVKAYLKETADARFFAALVNMPYLASEAKSSPIEKSLYRFSKVALECRIKEINDRLDKELKDV